MIFVIESYYNFIRLIQTCNRDLLQLHQICIRLVIEIYYNFIRLVYSDCNRDLLQLHQICNRDLLQLHQTCVFRL